MSALGLGTVQWGMPYGLSNCVGMTSAEEVHEILTHARREGISVLDTAALYGEAEAVLGAHDLSGFMVVTKTSRFATSVIDVEQIDHLRSTFDRSLSRLKLDRVHGLLVHHADDLHVRGGERIWIALEALRAEGRVDKIGVSVYDAAQLNKVLASGRPDLVQLPLSVFDQRLLRDGSLERLHSLDIEVHARSIFLQGLLLMTPAKVPAYFAPIKPLIERWHAACAARGMTPAQGALSFVRDLPGIDQCLIGVQNAGQLDQCAADFALGQRFEAEELACDNPAFVNPALWELQ